MRTPAAEPELRCSFCRKPPSDVDRLVVGPGVFICNECVGLCEEIIAEETGSARSSEGWDPPADDPDALLADLRRAAENLRPIEDRIQRTVTQLRGLGVTWARIGDAIGISRQAAWQRFSVPEGPDA